MKTTLTTIIAIAIGVALAGAGTVALAARNSSGTFSFASVAGGYPYISGQTISSSGVNANQAEVATALTDSLSRSGKGGMTAPLRCADGTAALPAFSWTSDTNTGIYRIGTDNIGISLGGTKKVDLASGLTAFVDPVSFAGSTTTTGIARFSGSSVFDDPATFNDAATFVSSVSVPIPQASTDAASKDYVDGATTTFTTPNWTQDASATVLHKSGRVVTFCLGVTAGAGASWSSIVTFPVGYRPLAIPTFLGVVLDTSGGLIYGAKFTIAANGVLSAAYYDNGASVFVTPLFAIGNGDAATVCGSFVTP